METSAEVAEWGEQWLSNWIAEPGLAPDERETREWLAEGWRQWTLESWVGSAHEWQRISGGYAHDEFSANHEANNHYLLYLRERSGLLVWRMFGEYRRRGLPVPEAVLGKFDEWADRLERASGVKEIASAIEMTGEGGGPQGAAHLRKVERQRYIASDVHRLHKLGLTLTAAQRRVATDRGMTLAAVRSAWLRWMSGGKERDKRGKVMASGRARDKRGVGDEPESARLLRRLGA